MSLVMLPLGGGWFGGVSLAAAPVNLLLVPLVGFFVVPLCLLGLVAVPIAPQVAQLVFSAAVAPLQAFLSWPWLQPAPGSPLYLPVTADGPELALAALGRQLGCQRHIRQPAVAARRWSPVRFSCWRRPEATCGRRRS